VDFVVNRNKKYFSCKAYELNHIHAHDPTVHILSKLTPVYLPVSCFTGSNYPVVDMLLPSAAEIQQCTPNTCLKVKHVYTSHWLCLIKQLTPTLL